MMRRNLGDRIFENSDDTHFYPMLHAVQDIETLTVANASRIISPSEVQKCESGLLHGKLSSIRDVPDMITLMTTHSQRPFYMVDRFGKKNLFMYVFFSANYIIFVKYFVVNSLVHMLYPTLEINKLLIHRSGTLRVEVL